jgi:hypothetical protein
MAASVPSEQRRCRDRSVSESWLNRSVLHFLLTSVLCTLHFLLLVGRRPCVHPLF